MIEHASSRSSQAAELTSPHLPPATIAGATVAEAIIGGPPSPELPPAGPPSPEPPSAVSPSAATAEPARTTTFDPPLRDATLRRRARSDGRSRRAGGSRARPGTTRGAPPPRGRR